MILTWNLNQKLNLIKKENTVKKFGNDVMSEKYHVLINFSIYGQFGGIRKPDSGRIVYKTYILINNNL